MREAHCTEITLHGFPKEPKKPRRSQSSWSKCHSTSKRSTGNFTEVEKEYPTSRSGSVERPHFFGPVIYMIFGTMWGYPIQVYEPLSKSRKNPLATLDMPVYTDRENMDSTLREELRNTATFYGNLGRSCNIDDPGWNWSNAWETTESTSMVNLESPGVPRTKESGELTDVEC